MQVIKIGRQETLHEWESSTPDVREEDKKNLEIWPGPQKSSQLQLTPAERAISSLTFTLTLLEPRQAKMWMSWESWTCFHTVSARLSSETHLGVECETE